LGVAAQAGGLAKCGLAPLGWTVVQRPSTILNAPGWLGYVFGLESSLKHPPSAAKKLARCGYWPHHGRHRGRSGGLTST